MRSILTSFLFFFISTLTWSQEILGKVYNPMPVNAAGLFLKNEGMFNINIFSDNENNLQKVFSIQGAYSPFKQIGFMGSFYRNTDNFKNERPTIKQKMTIFEGGIGYYFPKYTTSDKQRIKLWDIYTGASFGNASDNRFFEKGSIDLPFEDGFANLSTKFHSYFVQIGFHYILDMKIQLKFGGNLKVARTKIHYIRYRSNFLSHQLDNDVIWMPQLSTDVRLGYRGFWLHFQVNAPASGMNSTAQKYIGKINEEIGQENFFQIGIEKTFRKKE